MKFGEKVRDLRKKHSLTQDELAKCLGVSKRTVIGWERDGRYPRNVETLEKMADIFHVPLTYIQPDQSLFIERAAATYGKKGKIEAQHLAFELTELFASGELTAQDMDGIMDILALLIEHCLAHRVAVHRLGQGVPSAKVFPSACEAHDLDLRLVLHHSIVEADLVQGVVFIEQVLIVHEIDQLMGTVQHIAQFEGEHAAVPERSLCNVVLCHFLRRLFLEHGRRTGLPDVLSIFYRIIIFYGFWQLT